MSLDRPFFFSLSKIGSPVLNYADDLEEQVDDHVNLLRPREDRHLCT